MKKFFDEPRLELETFAVNDNIMASTGFNLGEDELNPVND